MLDYLRDQKENPDPELLDKMNWTDEDLREFRNRWEKLKKESTDESGKRKWNDAIKSLGLKPATGNSRQTNRKRRQPRRKRRIRRAFSATREVPPPIQGLFARAPQRTNEQVALVARTLSVPPAKCTTDS